MLKTCNASSPVVNCVISPKYSDKQFFLLNLHARYYTDKMTKLIPYTSDGYTLKQVSILNFQDTQKSDNIF